ncbi:MAG: hypothetical protein EHM49_04010, partial [Deltaproteobacteria bacterium]
MKSLILVASIILCLAVSVPVFPCGAGDDNSINNTATATGGTANVTNNNTFRPDVNTTDINVNENKIERGAVQNDNRNIQGQKQKQQQKQTQGQEMDQAQKQDMNNEQTISPTQTTTIITEKPFTPIPTVGVPELNFGSGKVDWNFAALLPKIGVPLLGAGEIVKEVIDTTANVPIKRLLPTALSMKKAELPITYNTRIVIVKAEAQKSWTTGGPLSGGATGVLGTTGTAVGGSVIPSMGGTKAHDLYTIIF